MILQQGYCVQCVVCTVLLKIVLAVLCIVHRDESTKVALLLINNKNYFYYYLNSLYQNLDVTEKLFEKKL